MVIEYPVDQAIVSSWVEDVLRSIPQVDRSVILDLTEVHMPWFSGQQAMDLTKSNSRSFNVGHCLTWAG